MEPAIVCLRKGEERGIRAGAVWIFDNQIDWINDLCTDGGIVEIVDQEERFLARGYFNRKSKITVRILTRNAQESIDRAFFARRIAHAWSFRQTLGLTNACRVVFGESDGLPGLTVDKFGDCLSFQTVALGIDRWKPDIISILADLFHPVCIYERNDVPVREKEGLPQQTGCVYGILPDSVVIQEHDAKMLVDIAHGQKTGHFLDQQENRGRIRPYVPGRSVLDLCCCTGGFSIHAALYGAKCVEAVDASQEALEMVQKNARLNGVTVETTCANVFDLVRQYADAGRQFDTVICDPPAFAKSKRALSGAYRGYKELNLRSMKLVKPGGFLITCSCSQFMTPELFSQMLRDAAADVGRPVRLLETLMQSRDHPALFGSAPSHYLKGEVLQIL